MLGFMKFFSLKESSYFKTLGIIALDLFSDEQGPLYSFRAKCTLYVGAR